MGLFEDIAAWVLAYIIEPVKTTIRAWILNTVLFLTEFINRITQLINSWWNSTWAGIAAWWTSSINGIKAWINTTATSLTSWWSSTWSSVSSWVTSAINNLSASLSSWVTGLYSSLSTWITSITTWAATSFTNLWNSLTTLASSLTTWWNDQVGILQRGWDATFAQVPGLIGDAVSGVKTWVEERVAEILQALADSFFTGLTKGINEAGHSPLDVKKETDNEILKGLQGYMIKYREERDKKEAK